MKRLIVFLLAVFLMAGCAGLELKNDVPGRAIGYFSGKGVGIAVNVSAPGSVDELEANFDEFMLRNAQNEMVPPSETVALFNSSVSILAAEIADPYGLISDLTFLISEFGANLVEIPGEAPELTGVQPIPRVVYQRFEWGYDSGKRTANAL